MEEKEKINRKIRRAITRAGGIRYHAWAIVSLKNKESGRQETVLLFYDEPSGDARAYGLPNGNDVISFLNGLIQVEAETEHINHHLDPRDDDKFDC